MSTHALPIRPAERRAKAQRAGNAGRAARQQRRAEDVARLAALPLESMTADEAGAQIGRSREWVRRVLRSELTDRDTYQRPKSGRGQGRRRVRCLETWMSRPLVKDRATLHQQQAELARWEQVRYLLELERWAQAHPEVLAA